jgi:hypothetical protein
MCSRRAFRILCFDIQGHYFKILHCYLLPAWFPLLYTKCILNSILTDSGELARSSQQQVTLCSVDWQQILLANVFPKEVKVTVVYREGFNSPLPPLPKFRSFDKHEPNSQFDEKYIHNNLIRIRVSLICKSSETPDYGLPSPDPRSLGPLSSTEFLDPAQNFLAYPLLARKKFVGTLLRSHAF